MTQPHVLELAKQGDPDAIATLMNQSLQPRGMTALVDRQGDVLEVVLEAERVPNRDALTAFVQKGIDNLGIGSIRSIRIVGQQVGATFPAWMQELDLATDLFSDPELASLDTAPPIDLYAEPSTPDAPQVQSLEMPDLPFSEDSPPLTESLPESLPESGLDDPSTLDLSPLEFDDRPDEPSIDLLTTDSQQLALEDQLKTLWSEDQGSAAQPASDDLLGDFSLDASEPISESEFQDLFAEDSPETIASKPADQPSIEDLFRDTSLETSLENASEPVMAADNSIEAELSAATLDDLFAEEPSAPAIDDLFFEDSSMPTETASTEAADRSIDSLFEEPGVSSIAEQSATDLFGEPLAEPNQSLPNSDLRAFFADDDSPGIEISEESDLFSGEDFTAAPLGNFVAEESLETPVDFFDEELDTEESLDSTEDLSDLFGESHDTTLPHGATPPHDTALQNLDEPASLSNEADLDLSSLDFSGEAHEPAELDFSSDYLLAAPSNTESNLEPLDLDLSRSEYGSEEAARPESFVGDLPDDFFAEAEPGVAEPGVAEPGVAELGVAEPGVVEPGVAEPEATLFESMPEAAPIASQETTLQGVPEDLFTEELQGLHEIPIEYVFGEEAAPEAGLGAASPDITSENITPENITPEDIAPEPESRGNWLAGLVGLGAGAVAASSIAGSSASEEVPKETPEETRSLDLEQEPDQQELSAQIDNLWAEQNEEPTFELEEEPINSLESPSDLSFDWEVPTSETPDSEAFDNEAPNLSTELTHDSLTDLFSDVRSDEPTEPMLGEPMLGEPLLDEPMLGESMLDEPMLGESMLDEPTLDEPTLGEPMLLLEETMEAPPTGELVLDGELPAIEEIPMESASLDEGFLAEMVEQPTLSHMDDWTTDDLLSPNEPILTEEIPMEAADLDEGFLAEMAEQPTLPPADDWTDDLFLESPSSTDGGLTELVDSSEDAIDLSELGLLEPAVDPANPMEGSIPTNELLLDLEDEPAPTDPIIDDFSRASASEPASDEPASNGYAYFDSFGSGIPETALMADLPSELIDETPDEPIANLLHDPVQEDLGIDFLGEDPTTAASLPPVEPLTDDFEAELAGLTLDDLPESDQPESDLTASNWLESDSLEEMPSYSAPFETDEAAIDGDLNSNAVEPELDLAFDFLDDPTARRNQSFAEETDESFTLPADLLNQFDEPDADEPMVFSDEPQFQADEEAIDFLDLEPETELFPEDSSTADASPAGGNLWSADETDIDFLTEPPAASESEDLDDFEEAQVTDSVAPSENWLTDHSADRSLDSAATPSDQPTDEADLALGLDPNAFNDEDTAIADTNGWETESWSADESILASSESARPNGISEAALVAAGLVGAGASARNLDGSTDGAIGNGRDHTSARAIDSKGSPWLYTLVLLSVSGLIAGLLGYSLWSEVVSPHAPSTPTAPKASSFTGELPEQVAQAGDEPAS